MEVFRVRLAVIGQMIDPTCQQRALDLGRTGVLVMLTVFLDGCCLAFHVNSLLIPNS